MCIANKESRILLGAAARSGYSGVPALASAAGVPYQTAHKDMIGEFCGAGFDRFRAYVRHAKLTDAEIIQIVRGK